MFNYGFCYYESECLFSMGQEVMKVLVWVGQFDQVFVGLIDNVFVIIFWGFCGDFEFMVDFDLVIKVFINVGDELGWVKVLLNGEVLVDWLVQVLIEVFEGGFFKCIWDVIKFFFVQLFQ